MKGILLLTALIVLFMPFGRGQSFAFATNTTISECLDITPAAFADHGMHRRKIGTATIVGITALSTGAVVTLYGLWLDFAAPGTIPASTDPASVARTQQRRRTATAVKGVGIGIGIAGLACMVYGIVSDAHQGHEHRLSLVAPGINEMGLAYKF